MDSDLQVFDFGVEIWIRRVQLEDNQVSVDDLRVAILSVHEAVPDDPCRLLTWGMVAKYLRLVAT